MQLIFETWQAFAPHHSLRLENRITGVFRQALIDAYVAAGRNWFISLEDPIVEPTYGTEEGRNDLNFYPLEKHHGQTVFFTVECKRLHVSRPPTVRGGRGRVTGNSNRRPTFQHLATEYVEKGMQRFVDEQYSRGLPCGGMVGYVLDDQVATAFYRIQSEIQTRRVQLKMNGQRTVTSPSVALPRWQHSADTVHLRSDGDFTLHHLLVGVRQ